MSVFPLGAKSFKALVYSFFFSPHWHWTMWKSSKKNSHSSGSKMPMITHSHMHTQTHIHHMPWTCLNHHLHCERKKTKQPSRKHEVRRACWLWWYECWCVCIVVSHWRISMCACVLCCVSNYSLSLSFVWCTIGHCTIVISRSLVLPNVFEFFQTQPTWNAHN